MSERLDCVVVGAGVVGLAVARALALAGREVVVLEQADSFGTETSSRNSEVIHAGIYYPKGSLKARLCVAGRDALYDYCEERGIPHRRIGKIILAVVEDQLATLRANEKSAIANGVDDLRWLNREELGLAEPNVAGIAGLLSPSTGIVDSHALMLNLVGDVENAGGSIVYRSPALGGGIEGASIRLEVGGEPGISVVCTTLVNAGGLHAQKFAGRLAGFPAAQIPPRHIAVGQYFTLSGAAPFEHLIYPVPEDGGLGIHVALDMAGQVRFGPDVKWLEEIDYAFEEARKPKFVEAIRRYYPGLDPARLQPGYTGIRPKLTGKGGGFADFRIDGPQHHGVTGLVNLFGIESPGLTAALAIGDHVAAMLPK
ncbi:MAG: NAD(P)/FAD-dependent oxidoreductase [Alphaproteobacteria bacterium]